MPKVLAFSREAQGDLKPFQTVEQEQMLMHMQVFYILGRYDAQGDLPEPRFVVVGIIVSHVNVLIAARTSL